LFGKAALLTVLKKCVYLLPAADGKAGLPFFSFCINYYLVLLQPNGRQYTLM
jgi:hypothetical protein